MGNVWVFLHPLAFCWDAKSFVNLMLYMLRLQGSSLVWWSALILDINKVSGLNPTWDLYVQNLYVVPSIRMLWMDAITTPINLTFLYPLALFSPVQTETTSVFCNKFPASYLIWQLFSRNPQWLSLFFKVVICEF